jgi:DNA-3-methyladenine glycosylase
MNERLTESFFNRDTVQVARDLLGKELVHLSSGGRVSGIISETEAYRGEEDLACHARAGRTPRTEIMFGPPGRAYIYFVYGMHWLLNFVTEGDGSPGAVLIRSIQPLDGLDIIAERRNGRPHDQWTDGPAKLCQALDIDGRFNGINICDPKAEIFIIDRPTIHPDRIQTSPRIGLDSVPEPWHSIPWRFVLEYR